MDDYNFLKMHTAQRLCHFPAPVKQEEPLQPMESMILCRYGALSHAFGYKNCDVFGIDTRSLLVLPNELAMALVQHCQLNKHKSRQY